MCVWASCVGVMSHECLWDYRMIDDTVDDRRQHRVLLKIEVGGCTVQILYPGTVKYVPYE